ncbi:hypothetical protein Q0590_25090 [Rhodocytophaga aerolata]|uniref:Uncharacterized protein n=1 Tax=Rhodocytophaga aerolata TaxID=455078 RepID=A0ABT8RFT3_9BACT|nr:hypothetical protein [Rhodocytophaga aerolata]MDO1449577.1 hypothetical protein [Rhodocytophaga aerolata]
MSPQNSTPQKQSFSTILNNVLGSDGIKTDVQVKIADDLYYKLVAALVVAFLICTVINVIIKSVAKG